MRYYRAYRSHVYYYYLGTNASVLARTDLTMNTQGIRFCQQWNHDYASDDGTASVLLVVQAAPQRNKSRTFTTQRNTTTSRYASL